jgi:uncharacterized damage-inducible protein DinB
MKLKSLSVCLVVSGAGVLLASAVVGAQRPPAPTAATAAAFGFKEVSGWLAQTAELIPADKYTFKPVATVRSVGEMLAHVADGMAWYCGQAAGSNVDWSDAVEKGKVDKPTVTAALKTATDRCAAVYADPKARIERLFGNVAHANLHYGNLVTYMRMLGLKPPSS